MFIADESMLPLRARYAFVAALPWLLRYAAAIVTDSAHDKKYAAIDVTR